MIKLQLTPGSPSLCSLLQLEKHVTTVVIIVEVVNFIDDQDRWAAVGFAVAQSHLLECVESSVTISDGTTYRNTQSHLSRYPMQDRLWCETRNHFSLQCNTKDRDRPSRGSFCWNNEVRESSLNL